MKILLVNPCFKTNLSQKYEKYYIHSGSRWPHSGVKKKGNLPHYLPFPFFLAYSASLLRENGFEVYVLDAVALDLSQEDFLEKVKEINPDLFFYEVTTPTCNYDLSLARILKKIFPQSILVLGGPHSTIFGKEILKDYNFIDFILKGEYEFSLLSLVKLLREGRRDFPLGIVYRNNGEVIDSGYPSLVEPLDLLPPPARDIFPSNDHPNPTCYWDGFCQLFPAIQMHTSRGCPYRCYFCLYNQVIYNNGKYRTFSPMRVVDEMEGVIRKYNAKEIYFDDDDFTINRKHVLSICNEIIKRKLKIKWSCMADAINLDEKMIERMKESGCIGIKFGIESASHRILRSIGKPVNLEKVKKVTKLCLKYRIKSHATFSLGLLNETNDDVKKTLKFASSLDVDSIQISIATPFPGTKFFQIVEKEGFLRSKDWELYDGKVYEIVSHPYLDWKKVSHMRKKALFIWLIKNICSPFKFGRRFYIFSRSLSGMGIRFFVKTLFSFFIDEAKNK
jgi:radical SAM superfamily enzyme YgiQ (UPF0313 family)